MNTYLEFSDGSANKFWSVSTEDCAVTVIFGKIGTAGQTQIKEYDSAEEAQAQAQRQAVAKIKKGYAPATPPENFGAAVSAKPAKPAASKPAKKAAKPATPKPAKAASPKVPAPVTDDGTLKPWHQDEADFWEYGWYCCDEEVFSFEALMNSDEKPVEKKIDKKIAKKSEEKKETRLYNWGAEDDGSYAFISLDGDDDDDDDDDYADAFRSRFARIALREPLEKVIQAWDDAKKAGLNESALQAGLNKAFTQIMTWTLYSNGRNNLEWLVTQGAEIVDRYSSEGPYAKSFLQSLSSTKDVKKALETMDNFLNTTYDKMAKVYADGLRKVMTALISGTIEENSGVSRLPNEEQQALFTGFRIRPYEESTYIYPLLFDSSPNSVYCAKVPNADEVDAGVAAEYLPQKLRPLIDEMVAEGLFDKFPSFKVCIQYDDGEVFYEKILDQKVYDEKVEAANAMVQMLETTDDFKGQAEHLKLACYYMTTVLTPVDVPRMSKLLSRFLYSLDSDAEDAANSMLCKYDDDYPQLQYDRALWLQANGSFRPAHNVMGFASNRDYAPAAEKMAEFENLAEQRAKLIKGAKSVKRTSGRKKVTFEKFAESDLFINNDNIIARADSDGYIRLRFKIEGEAGYSDALDYLINLLEKGYARIHDGYTLKVRLLRKPEFIKRLPGFPKNTCHAFFAAAVKFPALREKVRRYADLALVDFDWYSDLDGEENTVTGTFAACALAFCDEKYIHMAGQYARVSDNEHQYIQLEVAPALIKEYGAIPEVAKAIYDINCSNGQDGDMGRLNKNLWMLPENLSAVMEHIENGTALQHHTEHHFVRYVMEIMGDDVKKNLKRIVITAKEAPPEQQKVFEDFYNMYKNYASEYDNEDYGNDLALTTKAAAATIEVPVYNEGEPVVMSVKEFQEKYPGREIDDDEEYGSERRTILFVPSVIDNPYIADYTLASWNLCGKIARQGTISFFWYPSVIKLDKWVVNLTSPAKQYGAVMFDGKNKPYVLYGKFNVVPLFSRFHKRAFKSAAEAEVARLANLLEEAPDFIPVPKKLVGAMDRYDMVCSSLAVERYHVANMVLPTFTPDDGFVYDAALIQRGMLAHKFADSVTEKAVYEELSTRLPQYAEYWEEKLKSL